MFVFGKRLLFGVALSGVITGLGPLLICWVAFFGHNEAFGRCWVEWEIVVCELLRLFELISMKEFTLLMKFVSIYSMSLFDYYIVTKIIYVCPNAGAS